MSEVKKVILVDLSGVFRRYWHVMEHEPTSEALIRTVNDVHQWSAECDGIAVCVDYPPYRRSERIPEYKANREKPEGDLYGMLRATEERIREDGICVLKAEGYEADDIIATACAQLWADNEIRILSSDKDLMQLVCNENGITVQSINTGTVYDEAAVKEKHGVPPQAVPALLALMGDKSDNLPGIQGVGPKTAAKMLNAHGLSLKRVINAAIEDQLEPARFREPIAKDARGLLEREAVIRLEFDAPIDASGAFDRTPKPQESKGDPMEAELPGEPEVIDAEVTESAAEDERSEQADPVPEKSNGNGHALTPAQQSFELALEPYDVKSARGVANVLFESRMFGQFPNREAILSIIMTGRTRGMTAVQSLLSFHNIKGKPCPHAALMIAWAKQYHKCEYFRVVESTDTSCTWETKHVDNPEPDRETFTIKDAERAGLLGGDNYKKRPKIMLRWRAGVDLARYVYPEIFTGIYSVEEMTDA